MTDFHIIVQIDPRGAQRGSRQVERQLNRLNVAAERTRRLFTRVFAFVGLGVGISGLISLTDQFTVLNNRLRTVVGSQEAVNESLARLATIARNTRTPLDSIVALYQRGSIAADELGVSQEQLFLFTERVGQALAIQGSSAREASGALLQLSQSLGSGIVRAEEFNSILEGAFPIAQAAARGLDRAGGSVARLRTLIIEGRVTSSEFFNAFLKGSENLQEIFERTVPTISQAFTVLRDSIVLFLGELDKGPGLTAGFAKAILLLADNLDILVRALGGVINLLLIQYARTAVPAAIAATRALSLAIAANPLGALAVALTTIIALIIPFADQIQIASDRLISLADLSGAAFDVLAEKFNGIGRSFSSTFDTIAIATQSLVGEIEVSFIGLLQFLASAADFIAKPFVIAATTIFVVFTRLGPAIVDSLTQALNSLVVIVENTLNRIVRAVNLVTNVFPGIPEIATVELGRLTNIFEGAADGFKVALKSAVTDGLNFDGALATLNEIIARANEAAAARARLEQPASVGGSTEAAVPDVQTLDTLAKQIPILEQILQTRRDLENQIKILNKVTDEEIRQTGEFQVVLQALNVELAQLNVDTTATFGEGFLAQLELMSEATRNVSIQFAGLGTQIAEIFGPGGTLQQGIGDATADAIVFGKSFSNSMRAVGQQILSSIVSALVNVLLQLGTAFLFGKAFAAAWSPAATLASIATLGGAAAAGATGVTSALAATSAATSSATQQATLPTGGGLGGIGAIPGFADGGLVFGPGSSLSDSVTARVSPGEFIVNAAATRQNLGALEAINAGGRAGNTIHAVFAPIINVNGGTIDEEQLAAEMQEQFSEFLENELQIDGRLEGQGR